MTRGLRIVVTGLAATYPLGGVFWDYLQYPLGLHRLGHEVLYLEDTGNWCYSPVAQTFTEDGTNNAALLAAGIAQLEPALKNRWFFRDATGATFGRNWPEVVQFCREADLFLHISASCWMRDEYWAAGRVAFVDSDPMYTQASVPGYIDGTADAAAQSRVDMLRRHHVFFTFGENIGAEDCLVPSALFDWIPTRQPIVLNQFFGAAVPVSKRRPVLTTIASWEPKEAGPLINGVQYQGKSSELERFLTLPSRSALPLEIALSGPAPRERLRANGWNIVDPSLITGDPWTYRDYLSTSCGEWSVAKNAYVASRSGWFSCRTACYLALGVPAVVQDTGFGCAVPTGDGVLAFRTPDEAVDAVQRVASDPARHARAAREIAAEYFDSDKVLTRLVEQAMNGRK